MSWWIDYAGDEILVDDGPDSESGFDVVGRGSIITGAMLLCAAISCVIAYSVFTGGPWRFL